MERGAWERGSGGYAREEGAKLKARIFPEDGVDPKGKSAVGAAYCM